MSSMVKEFTASGLTARLFEIVQKMPEQEKKNLLLQIGDQREYQRTPYLMQVAYDTREGRFTDFILDISPGGIFLETVQDFFVGQKLDMILQFRGRDESVKVTGHVAWQGVNGVGIQFMFDDLERKKEIETLVGQLK